MSSVDTRQIPRDSLFLLSTLRLDGEERLNRIKVRNLSAGGMMAEGPVRVRRGTLVHVDLRNVGWVMGSVAWVQDNRFGVAFDEEIDSQKARRPLQTAEGHEAAIVKPLWSHRAPPPPEPTTLRKI